jgi:hypothetical protein
MGETAQKLRLIFDAIRTTRGVYLFVEIDALAASRGNENDVGEAWRILNSFLQFLDEDTGPSIVVATTNIPEILDRAILRRFELVLPCGRRRGKACGLVLDRQNSDGDACRLNGAQAFITGAWNTAEWNGIVLI